MSITGPANEISQSRLARKYGEPSSRHFEHGVAALETLPDADLIPLAIAHGIIPDAAEYDRTTAIENLAGRGIATV